MANIDNPYQALNLAKSLLKSEDSIIAIQTGYHPTLFGKGIFDYIYHEHYSYFNLKSLSSLDFWFDKYPNGKYIVND